MTPVSYPQIFISRFLPMADGTMAVPAVHRPPYLSEMGEPGRIPETSVLLGGSNRMAADGLKEIANRLMVLATVSAFQRDGLAAPVSRGSGLRWRRGDSSLFWTATSIGHCMVSVKDHASSAVVIFDRYGESLNVEVEKSSPIGRCAQENKIDAEGRVSTEKFEFEAFFGKDRGARLPYFSGWHFMSGGMACFDASDFLIDVLELALMVKSGEGPLAVSFELIGGDDEVDLGVWDISEDGQTSVLSGYSPIERALAEASCRIVEDPSLKIYFSLHRQGDPKRGGGEHALPLSVDGVVSQEALFVKFINTNNKGLMRLPGAMAPALNAIFPRSGQ